MPLRFHSFWLMLMMNARRLSRHAMGVSNEKLVNQEFQLRSRVSEMQRGPRYAREPHRRSQEEHDLFLARWQEGRLEKPGFSWVSRRWWRYETPRERQDRPWQEKPFQEKPGGFLSIPESAIL